MRYAMIVLFLALFLPLSPVQAFAACTTYTILDGGRIKTCQQCCYGNQCTVNCF